MRCTAEPCPGLLQYRGGENTEDFGCSVPCWASREISYHTHVAVRSGWYYIANRYHLPFRWIDVRGQRPEYNYSWYSLVGDESNGVTKLQGLKLEARRPRPLDHTLLSNEHRECVQETLHSVPYTALPANDHFLDQFHILRDRIMNEWLAGQPNPSRTTSPSSASLHSLLQYLSGDLTGSFPAIIPTAIGTTLETIPFARYDRQPQDHLIAAGRITLTPEIKQLIETATLDTVDDASERAALKACRALRRLYT